MKDNQLISGFIIGVLVGFGLSIITPRSPEKVYEDRYIIINSDNIEGTVIPCPIDQNWKIHE